jgi:hypothetical protein
MLHLVKPISHRSILLASAIAATLGFGSSCRSEKGTPAMEGGGLLPTDVTTRPAAQDGEAPASMGEPKPLLPTEFVFRREGQVLAYDLAANRPRLLFANKEVIYLDLSPDRKWLLGTSVHKTYQMTPPFLSVSVDGQQTRTTYQGKTMDTTIEYNNFAPSWSTDGTKIFFVINYFSMVGTEIFTESHPVVVDLTTQRATTADCEAATKARPRARAHPVDPNVVLILQGKACAAAGAGLNEFTVTPFAPRRTLLPFSELDDQQAFEWQHDGAGVIYLGKGGLIRLDVATGTKTPIYKPDSNAFIYSFAVGPADEIVVALASRGVDAGTLPTDIYRVSPETGMATALTSDGKSYGPTW